MQTIREIVLLESKPETEWILGRPVQKVMPTRDHGILQLAFAMALRAWGRQSGDVVTEWRLRVSIPGEDVHPLVPDVAYMSYERLRPLSIKERKVPPVPPEIVVEILSPDDRPKDVAEKVRVYLEWGVTLILIVDPDAHTVDVYDSNGHKRVEGSIGMYSPPAIPGLYLPLRAIFAELEIPK